MPSDTQIVTSQTTKIPRTCNYCSTLHFHFLPIFIQHYIYDTALLYRHLGLIKVCARGRPNQTELQTTEAIYGQ